MVVRFLKRTARVALSALTLAGLAVGSANAGGPYKSSCDSCPAPTIVSPGERSPTPTPMPPGEETPFLGEVAGGATGGEVAALTAPNILGNYLGASKSVSFFVNRSQGFSFLFNNGTTSIINSKIADNNSPIPQDRIGFRYNYFSNAVSVTGLDPHPPVPDFTLDPGRGFVKREFSATRDYDVNMYTFDLEKTLCDGLASVQLRIPFAHTLAAENLLQYGVVTGTTVAPDIITGAPTGFLQTQRTPFDTFGHESTEFGDMDLALKALLWTSDNFNVSGGVSIHMPTGPDTRVTVIDYLGLVSPQVANTTQLQRRRDFLIQNDTWEVSPFVAFLAQPSCRAFLQGFVQFEIPVNSSDVFYAETIPVTAPGVTVTPPSDPRAGRTPPFATQREIEEQSLLHVDLSAGYWLLRNGEGRWITGIAPSVELHYTTTLENADLVTLPRDFSTFSPPGETIFGPGLPTPGPVVGNRRNRLDILDVTLATTVELANHATLATGVSFPLREGDNRTYDWEFQVQFNWYFGCPRQRVAPNF